MEALVAAGTCPAHQEDGVTVAQHDVRDDLLPGRILLGLRSRPEPAMGAQGVEVRRQWTLDHAAPVDAAGDVRAAQSENLLSHFSHQLRMLFSDFEAPGLGVPLNI